MSALDLIDATAARLRIGVALWAAAAGVVTFSVVTALWRVAGANVWAGAAAAGLLAAAAVLVAWQRGRSIWAPVNAAAYIERQAGGLDNLLVTAACLRMGTTVASARMEAEVLTQAADRVAHLQPGALASLAQPAFVALLAAAGAFAVASTIFDGQRVAPLEPVTPGSASALSLRATITPPSYLGRATETLENPDAITLTAGSRLRLEAQHVAGQAWLTQSAASMQPMNRAGDGVFWTEWQPGESRAVVVASGAAGESPTESRLLQVTVVPDRAPRVRVVEPARDLAFNAPSATVAVVVDAEDEEGLAGLRVAYVKSSGSGESFEFAEGDAPVSIERMSATRWRGRASLSLEALALDDGDALVYRALVRDTNPAGDWVSSDAFTIDVGARLESTGAGFAIPDEDRRYAISQQMVIVKTERLQAERPTLGAEEWAERTRMLAIEQRMVRSEVVFLSGGEVQDEVEEAEHSHELQEGRLENRGRAEMLRAINEMSRAEARLNAGDTAGALPAERAALAALQRAFDRRRYFLRTLAERLRIDPARRLTGDARDARSSGRPETPAGPDALMSARDLIVELAAVSETGRAASPSLLTRLASVDGGAGEWPSLAATLAAAASPAARQEAALAAMGRLSDYARARLGPVTPVGDFGELRGRWRDEWPGRRQ